tara:strand:+ start:97 stop:534 length:438 start_codon:yes stop_codon:yes gene_type:complete
MKRYTQAKKTQMLTGGLEHFTVTGADIVPTADGSAEYGSGEFKNYYEQARVWEKLIEVFRTRGNVVIVSELAAGGFTVAVEHKDAINPAEIQEKIRELGEVPFGTEEVTIDPDGTPASGDEYTEVQDATVDLSGVTVTKVDYDLL